MGWKERGSKGNESARKGGKGNINIKEEEEDNEEKKRKEVMKEMGDGEK